MSLCDGEEITVIGTRWYQTQEGFSGVYTRCVDLETGRVVFDDLPYTMSWQAKPPIEIDG